MRKRSKHNLSHYRMHTADMGELFPVGCIPVLPGDSFQHAVSMVVRVSPLNTPVMHPVTIRTHSWFVPNRVIWPETEDGGWEQFITGGPDGNNSQSPPTVLTDNNKKSVLSYLGLPPTASPRTVNAMPLRAFNKIVNTRYLDQDIGVQRDQHDNTLPRIAWEKDYFTTSRPTAQKGPGVTLPIGQSAPVIPDPTVPGVSDSPTFQDSASQSMGALSVTSGSSNLQAQNNASATGLGRFATSGLIADLANAEGVDINSFRAGFAIQRYQEARSRYGSRFTEYLRYLGINPSDARLQDPEYLGGGSARLNFSEVLQTTPSADPGNEAGVGDLYGHGIAGVRANRYRKFFEEHGYVIVLASVRPKSIYINGAHREWLKTTKEDYFQRELANLGQQEVSERELFLDQSTGGPIFGFQDRYDEYRQHWSFIGQDFRDTLNSWHLGRELSSDVALNPSFIDCNPSKRIFQVQSTDTLWCMINHKLVARRMVPKRANPRII